jgi:hypothetical protein
MQFARTRDRGAVGSRAVVGDDVAFVALLDIERPGIARETEQLPVQLRRDVEIFRAASALFLPEFIITGLDYLTTRSNSMTASAVICGFRTFGMRRFVGM